MTGNQDEDDPGQQVILTLHDPAQSVVKEPATDQKADADSNRCRRCQRHHLLIDEVGAGAKPVNDREQTHARQPGGIGFPFGPVQILRERFTQRPEQELLALVNATAVHRPQFTGDTTRLVLFACRRIQ